MESVWEACQFGSCTPTESNLTKPWIQVCLSSVQRFTSIIVQGPGNFDNVSRVTQFSLRFATVSGLFHSYILDGSLKVSVTLVVWFTLDSKFVLFSCQQLKLNLYTCVSGLI